MTRTSLSTRLSLDTKPQQEKTSKPEPEPPVPQKQLQGDFYDFSSFYEDTELADVTLIVDEHELKAHMLVLAHWSSVFRKMFTIKMEESQTRQVHLTSADVGTWECFLSFLYRPHSRVIQAENVRDLLALAHEYDVPLMLRMCEDFLVLELMEKSLKEGDSDMSGCFVCLDIAERFDLQRLKFACDDFLSKQRLTMQTCFEHMKRADNHDLPKFTATCLEFAAKHHKEIIHPQVLKLSAENLSCFLQKLSGGGDDVNKDKLSVVLQWVTHIPSSESSERIKHLPALLRGVFDLDHNGHLLSSEILDRIREIDLSEYGGEWLGVSGRISNWLVASWRQKFKTLGTSSVDLQERVNKVKNLIDTHQKATVCSVFQPSNLSVFGMDNAATHNYMLLEYTDVLNA